MRATGANGAFASWVLDNNKNNNNNIRSIARREGCNESYKREEAGKEVSE
jgi:hypothetical protein